MDDWDAKTRYQICSWLRNVEKAVENGNITTQDELAARLSELLNDIVRYIY